MLLRKKDAKVMLTVPFGSDFKDHHPQEILDARRTSSTRETRRVSRER